MFYVFFTFDNSIAEFCDIFYIVMFILICFVARRFQRLCRSHWRMCSSIPAALPLKRKRLCRSNAIMHHSWRSLIAVFASSLQFFSDGAFRHGRAFPTSARPDRLLQAIAGRGAAERSSIDGCDVARSAQGFSKQLILVGSKQLIGSKRIFCLALNSFFCFFCICVGFFALGLVFSIQPRRWKI